MEGHPVPVSLPPGPFPPTLPAAGAAPDAPQPSHPPSAPPSAAFPVDFGSDFNLEPQPRAAGALEGARWVRWAVPMMQGRVEQRSLWRRLTAHPRGGRRAKMKRSNCPRVTLNPKP